MDEQSKNLRISPYGRISATEEDRAPGIDRQLRIVYPIIERRGGTPTREYVDNDKSAYKPDVIRVDGFEPWLADFIAGRTDGIAGYDIDRIFRQPMDLERVIKAYVEADKLGRPTALWFPSGSIDLTTSDGQAMARVLVTFANKSSHDTVRRVTDFYRDEAMKGNIFSNYPAYGRDRGGINEVEAEIIRDGLKELLAGTRPTALAELWRSRGIPTKRGKRWTGYGIVRLYLDPGIAGFAVYKGERLNGADGKPIMRADGAILGEDDWLDVCEAVRPIPGKRRKPTKSLLGGIALCGNCDCKMVRFPRRNGRYSYGCQSKDAGGCATVSISGNRLDELITAFVLALLEDQEVEQDEQPFSGQARLDEIARLRRENREARNAGLLPLDEWITSLKELESEEHSLKNEATKARRQTKRVMTVSAEFPDLPLDKKRTIIKTFIQAIVIAPSGRTGLFNPDRIKIVPTE